MNIKEFKEGDVIVRNAPCKYDHNDIKDGSWLGEKVTLLGIDDEAKVFFVKFEDGYHAKDEEPHLFSYARDRWDEGWTRYPTTMLEKIMAKYFPTK